jgi:uncharacterized membrane protein
MNMVLPALQRGLRVFVSVNCSRTYHLCLSAILVGVAIPIASQHRLQSSTSTVAAAAILQTAVRMVR